MKTWRIMDMVMRRSTLNVLNLAVMTTLNIPSDRTVVMMGQRSVLACSVMNTVPVSPLVRTLDRCLVTRTDCPIIFFLLRTPLTASAVCRKLMMMKTRLMITNLRQAKHVRSFMNPLESARVPVISREDTLNIMTVSRLMKKLSVTLSVLLIVVPMTKLEKLLLEMVVLGQRRETLLQLRDRSFSSLCLFCQQLDLLDMLLHCIRRLLGEQQRVLANREVQLPKTPA
mmetsp:Transcript_41984/g.98369  ORF Transcript_41984/g.98369 Transcript_41984/m.98369 type:complete len:227 (+) Transcript_41984:675-1355(+)